MHIRTRQRVATHRCTADMRGTKTSQLDTVGMGCSGSPVMSATEKLWNEALGVCPTLTLNHRQPAVRTETLVRTGASKPTPSSLCVPVETMMWSREHQLWLSAQEVLQNSNMVPKPLEGHCFWGWKWDVVAQLGCCCFYSSHCAQSVTNKFPHLHAQCTWEHPWGSWVSPCLQRSWKITTQTYPTGIQCPRRQQSGVEK